MARNTLGWEEWICLPDLGLPAIKAKIDTGARTSALHAFAIEPFGRSDRPFVRFGVHPIPERPEVAIFCSAPIVDRREVTSSNGETELRYIIRTMAQMGDHAWPIEVSLTNRETMQYRMLLGRRALSENMVVDPGQSFQQPILSYDLYDDIPKSKPADRALRIALLTREPNNFSTRRLIAAAEARGHVCEVVNTSRCYMNINELAPEIHYDGKVLPRFDAVIPRIGASVTSYGMSVVRQFNLMGSYCLNSASAIGASRDKLYAHQLLALRGIGMPVTAFANSPRETSELIDIVGGAPLVVKLLESTQGRGVVLAETRKAASSVIDAFRGLDANFLVQEFVKEAAGVDIRCFVIGNKVVAAMKREAESGEFRSNLHQGGKATKVRITKAERETAIKAARVIGLNVAGVDMLRSESGPKVLEVNSSPGIEGIEKTTGKDIAGLIIEHIEKNVRIHFPRRRRRQKLPISIADDE
ncbi:MAG: 30S ribosomal protein S6--L-glutamate ligase [Alphaproteobacteria bacterium]|nr:MAG: 30S ribosomal protein S6--L-glutamate ligase [Alphaproteobacteria bacterium]